MRTNGGRAIRALIAVLLAAAGLLAARLPVSAHTNVVGSDPPDSAALSEAPSTVAVDFDKKVSAALTNVNLVDAEGKAYSVTSVTVDPARNTRLVIALPPLSRDTYRLSFSTRDSVDLHLTSGSIVFGVGAAPTLASQGASYGDVRPAEVAFRWVGIIGLCAVVGALVLLVGVVPVAVASASVRARLRRRLFVLGLGGVAAGGIAQVALLVSQALDVGDLGSGLRTLLTQSDFGLRWMMAMAILACLGAVLAVMARQSSRSRPEADGAAPRALGFAIPLVVVAGLLSAAAAVVDAISGHNGGDATPTLGSIAMRSAHVLAVGVWVGGLLGLVVIFIAMRRLPAAEVGTRWARAVVACFGKWAGPAFAVLLVSGLLLAGAQVATVTALFATAYGVILIVKVALVGGVGLLGARHARLGRQSQNGGRWRRLRLSIVAEAAGAALILGLASTLASSPPARGAQFEASGDVAPGIATVDAADLIIRVELRPNRPGRNLLAIDVLNTRRPIPGPVRGVSVELRRPGSAPQRIVTAPNLRATSYDGGAVDLDSAGELGITVAVERAGLAATIAQVPWQVNPNVPAPHPTVVSSQSLAPIVDTAAVIIVLVTFLFIVPWRRRRSRRTTTLTEKEASPA